MLVELVVCQIRLNFETIIHSYQRYTNLLSKDYSCNVAEGFLRHSLQRDSLVNKCPD